MIVIPFRGEHLELMEQDEQAWALARLTPEAAKAMEGRAAHTWLADGAVIVCAGITELWEGRYVAWAFFGPCTRHYWRAIHRDLKEVFRDPAAKRIEAYVDCGFEAAHRRVRNIGFKMEIERMRKFLPNGADASMYVMVKE